VVSKSTACEVDVSLSPSVEANIGRRLTHAKGIAIAVIIPPGASIPACRPERVDHCRDADGSGAGSRSWSVMSPSLRDSVGPMIGNVLSLSILKLAMVYVGTS
jgi:hypothetical protein